MKTIKVFFCLLIFSFLLNDAKAQLYFLQENNIPVTISSTTLSNAWTGGINFPLWSSIDLNGDGLMDLYMYDRTNDRTLTFINDGTPGSGAFHFDQQYATKFPKVLQGGWGKCFDYNCDGKMDFFTVDSAGNGIALYRNDYSIPTGLKFTLVSPRLTESTSTSSGIGIYATRVLIPTFVDVDSDGDFDILGFNSTPDGRVAYHKNYSMENLLPCDSFSFKFDSQCWGNFTLAFGENDVSDFHEPCPPPLTPDDENFSFRRPADSSDDPSVTTNESGYELAKRDDTITTIFAFDEDGNGLMDLLIGDIASDNSLLVHNAGTSQVAEADSKDSIFPSYDIPIRITDFVTHSYIDVDNDGIKDLIASAGQWTNKNGVLFYNNAGTNAAPVLNFQTNDFLQGSMIDEGEAAAPVLFDYNADGLMDLIIAHGIYDSLPLAGIYSQLTLYKNIGTVTNPAFEFVTDDYAGIRALNTPNSFTSPIYPAFGDMDNDGDKDMIIGDATGKLYYFNNSAGTGNPANFQFPTIGYMGIDVSNNSTPQITDLDNDGLPDLVIGEKTGNVNYFKNTGTPTSAFFNTTPTIDTLGKIVVQPGFVNSYSVPYVFKYNNTRYMLLTNMQGNIYLYNNIDGNLTGAFTCIDTLIRGALGVRNGGLDLTVSGGDLNNDTLPDMLVGLFSGGMQIFYGSTTNAIAKIDKENLFECFPNPANESLTIRFMNNDQSKHVFRMFNAIGEIVIEKKLIGSSFTIDTKNLSSGFYYVQITSPSADQSSCRKVIIYH